jgi:hypothetical protein
MKQLQNYSKRWKRLLLLTIRMELLLIATAILGGCAALFSADPPPPPEPKVIIETKYVEKNIPIQPRPKGLKFSDVKWYVVTPDTVDSLVPMFEKQLGEKWAFFVISVKDYENLALNMADIKRYLEQQKELIIYYETAVEPIDNKTETK